MDKIVRVKNYGKERNVKIWNELKIMNDHLNISMIVMDYKLKVIGHI